MIGAGRGRALGDTMPRVVHRNVTLDREADCARATDADAPPSAWQRLIEPRLHAACGRPVCRLSSWAGRAAPQRTLEHDAMGSFDLFLVPLGPRDGGMMYEAVFT